MRTTLIRQQNNDSQPNSKELLQVRGVSCTDISFAYQSKQDEDIIEPEPSFDDQARVHAQPNHQHYQRDEYGVDNDERMATGNRVIVIGLRP